MVAEPGVCCSPWARASCSRRRAKSFRTTSSGWRSRTTASATFDAIVRSEMKGVSRGSSDSSPPMASEAELRSRAPRPAQAGLLRGARLSGELERLQRQLERITAETTPDEIWRSVELARHQGPPVHARLPGQAPARGLGRAARRSCTGRRRGVRLVVSDASLAARLRSSATRRAATKERTRRNFGMAYPEGYRKAMRVMKLADRFGFPADHARRHAGRLSRSRCRAARQGGSIKPPPPRRRCFASASRSSAA